MKVTVRVFGELVPLLGRGLIFDLEEGASVKTLSKLLAGRIEGSQPGHISRHEIHGGELAILVNGRNIDTLNGLETELRDGDAVTLLPPFAGG
jgi:molybdopterin synthase sulfur carrier subunit